MEKYPAQMTVIGISKPGGPEVLLPETRSVPSPGPGEILVKVVAAGVNRPDVAQRSGRGVEPWQADESVATVARKRSAGRGARLIGPACPRRTNRATSRGR